MLNKKAAERWHGTRIISDVSSGKQTVVGKAPTKDVKSTFDAFLRLTALSFGRLYIGGTFAAPVASFPGDAAVGVVSGTRVHYDMATHEAYCALLQEVVALLGEQHKVEFIYRFGILAEQTHNATREGKSYADAQSEASQQLYAFMRAPAPQPVVQWQPGGPRGGGPKIIQEVEKISGKRSFEEIRKLPGFIEGLKTFGSDKDSTALTAKEAGKTRFCQYFTTGRTCTYGANCTRGHLCDVKLADGSLCLQAHSRAKHVADLGLPQYPGN